MEVERLYDLWMEARDCYENEAIQIAEYTADGKTLDAKQIAHFKQLKADMNEAEEAYYDALHDARAENVATLLELEDETDS